MGEIHSVDRLEDVPTPVPAATFVVADVIICSTAIIHLLEAGAAYVQPFAGTDRARAFRTETEEAVIVGEENDGATSEEFDLPPVPSIIRERDIAGRPVGIRTSNGTRAIDRIGVDTDILIGSTINAGAVADRLRETDGDIWLVAAGRNGSPVGEDLAAIELVRRHYDDTREPLDHERLREYFDSSPSTPWLRDNGTRADFERVVSPETTETVPCIRDGVFVTD
jgi:2-phosphosulfolactate phosphatase